MESLLDISIKDAAMHAVNQRLILQRVEWDFYERLLKQYEDSSEVHIAYDDGFLEVEVPLYEHERSAEVLRELVSVICQEREIDYVAAGSTTYRRRVKSKGVEPDTSFYIQNESLVRRLRDIDLEKDPPPDLVIEVDITSPSLNKMPIYAALAVPEVWLYKGESVVFYGLDDGEYREIEHSTALPDLDSRTATDFFRSGLRESSTKWIRKIREWVNK